MDKVTIGDATLYHGDCMDILPTLGKVDAVVTSPPYNLGDNHHTGNIRSFHYNDNLEEPEYQKWQVDVLNACNAVHVFYNHKNRIKNGIQISPYEWLTKTKWAIKQELVWINGSQNFDKIRFFPMAERIYWLAEDSRIKGDNSASWKDYFNWPAVKVNVDHGRQFPIQYPEIMIKFSNAEIALDPFMGSGTTGVACANLDRGFIGIEKERKYFDIACERIEAAYAQGRLAI